MIGKTRSSTLSREAHRSNRNMIEVDGTAELESALEVARRQLEEQRNELKKAKENESQLVQRLKDTEMELKNSKLIAEVERL